MEKKSEIKEITDIIYSLKNKEDLSKFLQQILTENEKKMLKRRWELVKLLDKGIPQREIAAKLEMSLCKVTRGAKELNKDNSIFKKILKENCSKIS